MHSILNVFQGPVAVSNIVFYAHLHAEMIFWSSLHSPGKAVEAHGHNRFSDSFFFFSFNFGLYLPVQKLSAQSRVILTHSGFGPERLQNKEPSDSPNLVTVAFVSCRPHRQTNTPQWKRILNCLVLSFGEE